MKKCLCAVLFMLLQTHSAWSLDLLQAYQLALSHDASWQANQLRLQVEQKNLGIAKAALLPTIGVNAALNKQTQHSDESAQTFNIGGQEFSLYTPETTTKQASVSLRQPLFRMDVWQQYKKVKISQQLAELKLQAQQQELMLNVAKSYFEVLRQHSLLVVYRQQEQTLGLQYQMMAAKYQEGLVAQMDVSEANAQYQSTIAKRVAGEVQDQLAREQLQYYIGRYPTDLADLSKDFQFQPPLPADLNAWLEIAQRNNLSLNQSRVTYQIAKQQIKIDQADYYPQLNAVASSTWAQQSPESLLSSNGRTDKVGIEFSWTPFNATRQPTIEKSKLDSRAAQSDLDSRLQQVHSEVKRAYLQVATGATQLNAYKVALDSATLVANVSQASQKEGLKSMVDVLVAQRNAFSARQEYVNAQYDYLLNVLQLRASSGQLNPADLAMLNAWLQ